MNPQRLSVNPNSLKSRFTKGFLRALIRIKGQRPTSCSPKEIFRRYRRVKSAADKSLACAVGSSRAWSRAMLFKVRNQERRRPSHALVRRINKPAMKKSGLKKKEMSSEESGFDQANDLRKLVPGGEAMDLCRLLEEAAHYIKCLNTQVQVMRSIADFCST